MHYVFEHPEFFDGVPRPDFKALNGNIVIYGAGFQGLLAAQLLEEQGVDVLCFGDQDVKKQGSLYHGLPVYSPKEMKMHYPNAVPIVTPYSLRPAFEYVRDELGYSNAVTPFSLFLEFDSEKFDQLEQLPDWYHPEALTRNMYGFLCNCVNLQTTVKLFSMNLSVSEVCNLRCKNCNALMPCYTAPKHFAYEDVLKDVNTLLYNRVFRSIFLEGGEPFLWKPFPELLCEVRERDNLLRIFINTNGTVIPNETLLSALAHPKITVLISDYGHLNKISELKPLFAASGVQCMTSSQKWFELSKYHLKPQTGTQFKRVISDCCKAGGLGDCYISDGKIYRCPEQGNLHKLGIFTSQENEYVDLRMEDKDLLQKKIDEFIDPKHLNTIPRLCHHCNGRGFTGREVPPAEQLAPGEMIQVRFE